MKEVKTLKRKGQVIAQVTYNGNGEEVFKETRDDVHGLPQHVAEVKVGGGLTKQTAPYEYARLDVSISIPCAPDDKSIQATYKRASMLVDSMLTLEYENLDL